MARGAEGDVAAGGGACRHCVAREATGWVAGRSEAARKEPFRSSFNASQACSIKPLSTGYTSSGMPCAAGPQQFRHGNCMCCPQWSPSYAMAHGLPTRNRLTCAAQWPPRPPPPPAARTTTTGDGLGVGAARRGGRGAAVQAATPELAPHFVPLPTRSPSPPGCCCGPRPCCCCWRAPQRRGGRLPGGAPPGWPGALPLRCRCG